MQITVLSSLLVNMTGRFRPAGRQLRRPADNRMDTRPFLAPDTTHLHLVSNGRGFRVASLQRDTKQRQRVPHVHLIRSMMHSNASTCRRRINGQLGRGEIHIPEGHQICVLMCTVPNRMGHESFLHPHGPSSSHSTRHPLSPISARVKGGPH
jgi:hypothetical protein